MANSAILIASLIFMVAMVGGATAETYVVGDSLGWTIPPGGPIAYRTWAARKDFQLGDVIVFNWTDTHNVAEVSETDYDNCTTTNPILTQSTSPANFTLNSNATRYFICTVSGHCDLGQKVTIQLETNAASSLIIGALSALLSFMAIYFLNAF